MKWNREQYIALMQGEKPARQMFCELFGLLVGLEGFAQPERDEDFFAGQRRQYERHLPLLCGRRKGNPGDSAGRPAEKGFYRMAF